MSADEVKSLEEADEMRILQNELEALREEVGILKQERGSLSAELSSGDAKISELDQLVILKNSELGELKQAVSELEEKLDSVSQSLDQAIISYKSLVIQANPDIIEELINGDSIEKVDESVERARALVSKVKEGLAVEASRLRIPVGAPPRTPIDFSALSPREKIQHAIGGLSS